MFFKVDSSNRLAVRKVLTGAGLDSGVVRLMRNAELGAHLAVAVSSGKIASETATLACATRTEPADTAADAIPDGPPADPLPRAPQAVAASLPADAAAALRVLLGVETPKVDEAAMRRIAAKLVRDELVAAGQRPAVIEIRTDGIKTGSMNGKATHKAFADVVTILSTRVNGKRGMALLVGPSGSGKTHLGQQVADALQLTYRMTGAVSSKYDLLGYVSPTDNTATVRTPLRDSYEYGGVFGWDEVDASDPRALNAFNALLDGGDAFAFPDGMVKRHPDFTCVASANTWGNGATAEYVGRNKLDGAFLQRFVPVSIDYDESLERDLVGPDYADWARFVQAIRRAVAKEGIKVLVTPRRTFQGAALLNAGMSRDKVEAMVLFSGMDADTVARLRKAA